MEVRDENWWEGSRGQALLEKITLLEQTLDALLHSNKLEAVPRMISVQDTCALLGGLSRATIYRWIEEGELDSIKLKGRRLILLSSVRRFLARCGLTSS